MVDNGGHWHPKAPDGHTITSQETTSDLDKRYSWEEYAEHSLTHDPEKALKS